MIHLCNTCTHTKESCPMKGRCTELTRSQGSIAWIIGCPKYSEDEDKLKAMNGSILDETMHTDG